MKSHNNPLVTCLGDDYEMSQKDIADKMFLAINTIGSTEKRAIENFKKALAERGLTIRDLLND